MCTLKTLLFSVLIHAVFLLVLWGAGELFEKKKTLNYPKSIRVTLVRKNSRPPQRARILEQGAKEVSPVNRSENDAARFESRASSSPNLAENSDRDAEKERAAPSGMALKIDAPDFPYPEYLALIQYKIEQNWQPPLAVEIQLTTAIAFRIQRNGEIVDVILERSSGVFELDQAAQRAVFNASPLPPLPAETSLNVLGVHFEFAIRGRSNR